MAIVTLVIVAFGWKNLLRYRDIYLRWPAAPGRGRQRVHGKPGRQAARAGDRHGSRRCPSSGDLARHGD